MRLTSVAIITRKIGYLQPLRPIDLQRPARTLRRIRMAEVLDTPRRPAKGAARGVHRARGRRSRRDADTAAPEWSRTMRRRVHFESIQRPARSRSRNAERGGRAAKASIPSSASSSSRMKVRRVLRHQHVARRDALAADTRRRELHTHRLAQASEGCCIYPIRDNIDAQGRQFVNWVVRHRTRRHRSDRRLEPAGQAGGLHRRVSRTGAFEWLDVPAMCRAAPT